MRADGQELVLLAPAVYRVENEFTRPVGFLPS